MNLYFSLQASRVSVGAGMASACDEKPTLEWLAAARAWNRAVTPSVMFWLFRDAGASASELAPSVMFCIALAGRAVDVGSPALE